MNLIIFTIFIFLTGCSSIDHRIIQGQQGEYLGFCYFSLGDNGIYVEKFISSPKEFNLYRTPELKENFKLVKRKDKVSPVQVIQLYLEPGFYKTLDGKNLSHKFYVGEGGYRYKNNKGDLVEVDEVIVITPSKSIEVLELKVITNDQTEIGYTQNNLFKDRIEGCD